MFGFIVVIVLIVGMMDNGEMVDGRKKCEFF